MSPDVDVHSDIDERTREHFEEILYANSEDIMQKYSCLIDFLSNKNEQDQVSLLAFLLENCDIPNRGNGKTLAAARFIPNAKRQELSNTLDEMIHGTFRLIIHSRLSIMEAAKMLRSLIFGFRDPAQRDYCLAEIMKDEGVPYRPIPQSCMGEFSTERLRRIAADNIDIFAQLKCVLRAGFGTTAQSELILKLLDGVSDPETRVGLFEAAVLGNLLGRLRQATEGR